MGTHLAPRKREQTRAKADKLIENYKYYVGRLSDVMHLDILLRNLFWVAFKWPNPLPMAT